MALGSLGDVSYRIIAEDQTGAASASSQQKLMAVGAVMSGVGIASIAMTKAATGSFLEFDTAMTEVKAVALSSGAITQQEFDNMRDAAVDFSKQMPIAATDFANAMYLMTSVGYDYNEVMAAIPENAKLAVAGSMSMAEATNAVINVFGVYKETAGDAGDITRVFANAVGLGKYEMSDFMTEIMKNIGTASQLGITFSDLAAYNVALQNSFTSSEEAGTSFNRMLLTMTTTGKKTFDELGISLTDNEGRFRKLPDILADVKTKLDGVSNEQERLNILNDMFGTYGMKAAIALMEQNKELPKLCDTMANADYLQGQYNTTLESYASVQEIANNKMEAAKIAFGEAMAPAVILTADAVSGFADILSGLPEPLQTVAGLGIFAGQGLAAIGPALMGLSAIKSLGLASSITGLIGPITSVGGALSTFLLSPAGLVIIAIAAVVTAIVLLDQHFHFIQPTIEAVGNALGGFFGWISSLGAAVGTFAQGAGRSFGTWLRGIGDGISGAIGWISQFKDVFLLLLGPIGAVIFAFQNWDKIGPIVGNALDGAKSAVGGFVDTAVSGFQSLLDKSHEAGVGVGQTLRDAFAGIGSVATGGVSSLGSAVQGMIQSFSNIGSIAGYAGAAFSGIGGAFNSMAGQVRGVFSQMFSSILGLINSTAAGFYNAGMNIITSIVNGIVAAAGGIVTAIANALQAVRALFPFSPAKEGPLAETPNWGTWMSAGMEAAGPEVAAAASTNLAAPAAAAGSAAAGGGGGAGGGGDIIYQIATGAIQINGANKSGKDLMDEIEVELARRTSDRRKARGMRS